MRGSYFLLICCHALAMEFQYTWHVSRWVESSKHSTICCPWGQHAPDRVSSSSLGSRITADQHQMIMGTSNKSCSSLVRPSPKHQRPKWSLILLWLLTRARTVSGISMHLPTFTGRSCLPLFPKSWDQSTALESRPSEKRMKYGLCGALQRSANWQSRPGWQREMGHQRWRSAAREGTAQPSTQGVIPRLNLDKDHEKILECKAKSRQVGKERGQIEGRNKEMQQ